jgi:hypothetical protein
MGLTTQQVAIVARLWQEHWDADFPSGLRGAEPVEGIDMVLLDLNIAGCVHTWLDNGGSLDAKRHRILRNCLAEMGISSTASACFGWLNSSRIPVHNPQMTWRQEGVGSLALIMELRRRVLSSRTGRKPGPRPKQGH